MNTNPGNFETYSVCANRDQLEHAGLMSDAWQTYQPRNQMVHPLTLRQMELMHNRVQRQFYSLAIADEVYRELKHKGLVAAKNWLS